MNGPNWVDGVAGWTDAVHDGLRIRARRIPGWISFSQRAATLPTFKPSPELDLAIREFIEGGPAALTVAKVETVRARSSGRHCDQCRVPLAEVRIDCAIGKRLGLVVEKAAGFQCLSCGLVRLPDEGDELRSRLRSWSPETTLRAEPSLLYDTPDHPLSVQFEVSTRCNLACGYCSHRKLSVKSDLSFDSFVALVAGIELERVVNVDFTGLGEALLNPSLPAMIAAVRERGAKGEIRLVTNGIALVPERVERLLEAGVTAIAVSIDTLDAEAFARQRGGVELDRVLRNLEQIVALRNRRGRDDLGLRIKAVLIENPLQTAQELVEYSARLGLDLPHLTTLDGREIAIASYDPVWSAEVGMAEKALANLWQLMPAWWKAAGGGPIGVDRLTTGYSHSTGAISINPRLSQDLDLCRWAKDSAFVTMDGSLLSCCEVMIDVPRQPISSLALAPMRDLWRNDVFWSLRLPLALGYAPAGCVGCAQAPTNARSLPVMPADQ